MLDPIGRNDVLRTIKTLNRERGVTVVLITHHMDEAAQADRLVVMAKGKVVADGAPLHIEWYTPQRGRVRRGSSNNQAGMAGR